MSEKNNGKKIEWYDDGHIITTLIIITILCIVISSQSFVSRRFSLSLLESIINHNSIYFLILIYFTFMKFPIGKKYFNYLNVFLGLVYLIKTATSFLTIIQSFTPVSLLSFLLSLVLFIYFIHTMFRDTNLWKEYNFNQSPFSTINNDSYYYAVVIISLLLLAVNLIGTVTINGVFLSILDTFYVLLFGRYVYIYRNYLDFNKINIDNEGNFDSVVEKVEEMRDKLEDVTEEVIDKVEDTVNEVKDSIDKTTKDTTRKARTKTKAKTKKDGEK